MGMYTGIRFKGYVKEEFRKIFKQIAMNGEWENSNVKVFANFGKSVRTDCIPCGSLSYMPDEWEKDYINEKGEKEVHFVSGNRTYYKQVPSDDFDRKYNEETGYWTFQCSLKNYDYEIEQWIDILPYFIEKIEHLEVYYEEDEYSQKYDLVDDIVKIVNDKFIKYNNY